MNVKIVFNQETERFVLQTNNKQYINPGGQSVTSVYLAKYFPKHPQARITAEKLLDEINRFAKTQGLIVANPEAVGELLTKR